MDSGTSGPIGDRITEKSLDSRVMRRALLAMLLVAGCARGTDGPSPVQTTADSRAAVLAGEYALTITLDEGCTQLPVETWKFRATLRDAGRYLDVSVAGPGFTDRTGVGQMYTFDDFTARFVWNFNDPEFNYPDPSINGPRLLLYGASDTTIRNGSMSRTIASAASTTLDVSRQCSGTHRFSLIATGG